MKVIELTRGQVAVVDDCDFAELGQWNWYYSQGYAKRNIPDGPRKQKGIFMHVAIMSPIPKGFECDHINGQKLDNRRCNLRVGTHSQNQFNRGKYKNNTTGAKGVFCRKKAKTPTFEAGIRINGKRKYLGCFPTLQEAKAAYDKAAIELHGAFARLN